MNLSERFEEFRLFTSMALRYRAISPRKIRRKAEQRYMQSPVESISTGFGFRIFLNPADRGVSAMIGGLGCWEPRVTYVFRKLLHEAHLVVDVGANVGWYTLLAARSGSVVHAFEPEPVSFGLLQKSIAINDFKNAFAFPYAIWEYDGEAELALSDSDNKGKHSLVFDVGRQKVTVPCRKLDTLFRTETIDILKLDVEGAEPEAIFGAQKLIEEGRIKYVLMEWSPQVWEGRETVLWPFEISRIRRDNLLLTRKLRC